MKLPGRDALLALALTAALAPTLALAGCKGDDADEISATPPGSGAAVTPPSQAPPTDATGQAVAPTRDPVPTTGAGQTVKPVIVDAGTPTDAGAPTDAGKPDAAAPDAGSTSARLKACADKCQSVMQSCLTPQIPTDGGLPTIKDPVACQKATDTCIAGCTR